MSDDREWNSDVRASLRKAKDSADGIIVNSILRHLHHILVDVIDETRAEESLYEWVLHNTRAR